MKTIASTLPLSRRRMTALVLACTALTAGTAGTALAQEVVKIGYSGPLSGGAAQYGKNVLDGALMAVNEVNATNPEIGGKKVKFEIVSLDDKYNPSETAINAQRLVQQHKTPAILVPHSGGPMGPPLRVRSHCRLNPAPHRSGASSSVPWPGTCARRPLQCICPRKCQRSAAAHSPWPRWAECCLHRPRRS